MVAALLGMQLKCLYSAGRKNGKRKRNERERKMKGYGIRDRMERYMGKEGESKRKGECLACYKEGNNFLSPMFNPRTQVNVFDLAFIC